MASYPATSSDARPQSRLFRQATSRSAWKLAFCLVLLLSGLYVAVMWRTFPATQADVGGDYAYVSWQMSRGAVLYHDLLGYQTPLLYLLGATAYRLWPQPDVFLAIALGIRAATVIAVFALARSCRFSPLLALLTSFIYLLLPMGFLFDAHFEPNILITLAGVLCALTLTRLSARRVLAAGLICGLALMAKLTFAPLALAFAVYLLMTRRTLLPLLVGSAGGAFLLCTALGLAVTGREFIMGAFLGNLGRTLSLANLVDSLQYLWHVEGFTLIAAIAGAIVSCTAWPSRFIPLGETHDSPGTLLACYLTGGLGTIGATIAIGSLAPEMLAAEPAVALCAALALRYAFVSWGGRRVDHALSRQWICGHSQPAEPSSDGVKARAGATRPAGRLTTLLVPLVGLVVIVAQPLAARADWVALRGQPLNMLACETQVLRQAAPAQAPVLAPAYAAFLARRQIVDGLADPFNWSLRVRRGDPTALRQVADVRRRLAQRSIAAVITVDSNPLPPEIEAAVRSLYIPTRLCAGAHVFLATAQPSQASPVGPASG